MEKIKKNKILLAIAAGIIIIAAAFFVVHKTVDASAIKIENRHYQHALDIWAADSDSITIVTDENADITEDFFDKYGEEILSGDCDDALDEMRENNYDYSYVVTQKNRYVQEENEVRDGGFGIGNAGNGGANIGTNPQTDTEVAGDYGNHNSENYNIESEEDNSESVDDSEHLAGRERPQGDDDVYCAGPSERPQ